MSNKGFSLVEIMIVVAIVAFLAAIAVPNFLQARSSAQSGACVNNLRLIDAAKEQYAVEGNVVQGAACASSDVSPYMRNNIFPVCPGTSTPYTVQNIGTFPTCSLSGAAAGAAPRSHRLD